MAAAPVTVPHTPPAPWIHWEPVAVPLRSVGVPSTSMPLGDEQIVREGEGATFWQQAPESLRGALRERGFAVVISAPGAMALGSLKADRRRRQMGAFYMDLQSRGIPFVVTMDALLQVTHGAFARALDEVEARALDPALRLLLGRLDSRLEAGTQTAGADLVQPYALARGLVSVARAVARGEGAPGLHRRGAAVEGGPRLGLHKTVAWLQSSPLLFDARGGPRLREGAPPPVNVAAARSRTRAALLLARLFDVEVDAQAASAWGIYHRATEFVAGAADDLEAPRLAQLASTCGIDVREEAALVDVVAIDRVRQRAAALHSPHLLEGAVPGAGLRLLGARLTPDGEVLQGLVAPALGRPMPSGLDVAAWLGSTAAREALHSRAGDASEGYESALGHLRERWPQDNGPDAGARHGSLYLSALDALSVYVEGSVADKAQPFAGSAAWATRRAEVLLAGWTTLRHDMVPFSHRGPAPDAAPAPAAAASAGSPMAPTTAFVEPHPEAIARLLALVRQTSRGLAAMATSPESGAPAAPAPLLEGSLAEAEDLLATTLHLALREANDEPFDDADRAALQALPRRLLALDEVNHQAGAGDDDVARVIDVHVDSSGTVLEEATGPLDELWMILREPSSGRLVLAAGAALPHHEFTRPRARLLADDEWRDLVNGGSIPPRHPFSAAYLVEAPSPW